MGVSLPLWQITAGAQAAWALHGLLIGSAPVQFPSLISSLLAFATVYLVARDRGQKFWTQLVFPFALFAALSALDLAFGAVVFGLVVTAPQLFGQFTQTRALVKTPDIAGVSFGYLLLLLTMQTLWFVFGLLLPDGALVICCGTMVAIATANMAIYFVRIRRAQPTAAVAGPFDTAGFERVDSPLTTGQLPAC